ncbi:cytochrome b5-like [Anticarsia gemmatalis]|uniref:cytochrome b5-like n=1 Tax=Anticarsia gemmatalis TaxID=129554 RepID=UPI003F76918F
MSLKLTSSEVKKHNNRKSLWIVIKNDVYDVTSYLSEHPGGEDPLLDAAGQDATRAFEDVGHSDDARSILKKYKIGSLIPGESCGSKLKWALLALAAAVIIGVAYKKYAS